MDDANLSTVYEVDLENEDHWLLLADGTQQPILSSKFIKFKPFACFFLCFFLK